MRISITGLQSFIKRQLIVLGDYRKFNKYYREYKGSRFYVLFVHNADNNGGAPVVLFDYAYYLRENGHNVIMLVGKGGELKDEATKLDIPCYQIGSLYKKYIKKLCKLNLECIIACTIVCYKYVNYIVTKYNKPIIWWLHEEDRLLLKYNDKIKNNYKGLVRIGCGSDRVRLSLMKMRPDIETVNLYYGCRDQYLMHFNEFTEYKQNKQYKQLYTITVIGRICDRKNQLQVVEAIKRLPLQIQKNIRIIFVSGSCDEEYKAELLKQTQKLNVDIMGPIPNSDLYRVYMCTDLIVCSSKDDPLPVVVTNAMMYEKPLIVSNKVGQSLLIENGVNGYVYDIDLTDELSNKIKLCYEYDNKFIGEKARNLFLSYFSMEILDKNIRELLK